MEVGIKPPIQDLYPLNTAVSSQGKSVREIDKRIEEISEKSQFNLVGSTVDFHEYISFYAKNLNLVNLLAILSVLKLNNEFFGLQGKIPVSLLDALKISSIGIEGLGEVLHGIDLGASAIKISSLGVQINTLKKELGLLIKYHIQNKLELPQQLIEVEAMLEVLEDELGRDSTKLGIGVLNGISGVSRMLVDHLPKALGLADYFLPIKLASSLISLGAASIDLKNAYNDSVLQWNKHQDFKNKHIKHVGNSDSQAIIDTSKIAQDKLKNISELYSNINENKDIDIVTRNNHYSVLSKSKEKISNSDKLNKQKNVIVKLVENKHSLEKNFTDFKLASKVTLVGFCSVAVAIGVGLTVAFFTGALSMTPIGWVIIGVNIASVLVSAALVLAYYGVLYRYKPHYFKATVIDGLSTKLLRNQFYYYAKEYRLGADQMRKEAAELQSSETLTSKQKVRLYMLNEQLDLLEKDKREWIGSVQEKIDEANWNDLVRYAKKYDGLDIEKSRDKSISISETTIEDIEHINQHINSGDLSLAVAQREKDKKIKKSVEEEERVKAEKKESVHSLLKANLFDNEVLDPLLQEIVKSGGNWEFLTSSDYYTQLRKQEAREKILLRLKAKLSGTSRLVE